MSDWISCKKRLPSKDRYVLTCNRDGWISTEMYCCATEHRWHSGYIVAWMELPKPYVEKNDDLPGQINIEEWMK